jgi:O-antigen ligase
VYLVIPSNIKNSDVRSASASEDIKERITQPDQERSLGTAYVNILFRYFIWRDMWQEFLKEKPFVMGFGLDHPQRSKSLEMLEWEGPWWEDGWITPHNSFLHIIYRGGIVGILLIIFMFLALINMIKKFSRMRSVPGGILLSVIIFGFISANFLVFLELPYTAIPFWFIFGVILAYSQELKTVR